MKAGASKNAPGAETFSVAARLVAVAATPPAASVPATNWRRVSPGKDSGAHQRAWIEQRRRRARSHEVQQTLPDGRLEPYGPITLDKNRQAIVTNYIATVTQTGGKPGIHTSYAVPNVNETFGGTFSPTTPSPGRGQPPCTKRSLPWQGKEKPVSFH